MPRGPSPGSVRAQATSTPARSPLVIHCLVPFRTHRSPRRSARVARAAASLPDWGSESAKAPASHSAEASRGRHRARCASVPKRATTSATMFVTAMVTESEASAAAISIAASA